MSGRAVGTASLPCNNQVYALRRLHGRDAVPTCPRLPRYPNDLPSHKAQGAMPAPSPHKSYAFTLQ
ncbi:MAG: hypothetical protein MSA28_07485 [Prevotella sp.]|nr:hypothetical protein [Prevotella sp.]